MKIQILYVPDCPNLAAARSSVQAALQDAGVHATVEEKEVVSFEDAARLGMHGSPTVLIDGQDPFAPEDEVSWSCRLYRSEAGIAGSPTVAQLTAVLARREAPQPLWPCAVSSTSGSPARSWGGRSGRGPERSSQPLSRSRSSASSDTDMVATSRMTLRGASPSARIRRDDGDNECCDLGGDLLREDLTAAAIELAVKGFAALWHAKTPTRDALLPGRAELADEVLIELVQRGRAEVDADGVLIGVHGLTGRPTRHRFVHAGRLHYTWCAFDSVGIPAAMSLDAIATSDCPTCGRQLTVELRDGDAAHEAIALWLPTPERTSDLMKDFCASADLFCSTDHLCQRIDVHGNYGRVVPLEEALALGRETWSDVAEFVTVDKPERRDNG